MKVNMTPARRCRLSFYSNEYFSQPHLIPKDFDFEYHEQKLYKLSKDIKEAEEVKKSLEKDEIGLFMVNTGLFCFGHLDVVEDIINYYQFVPRPIKALAAVLPALLPLPKGVDMSNLDLFKRWFLDNRKNLGWSEQEGIYLLK